MGRRRAIAEGIVGRGGGDVPSPKGNRGSLYEDVGLHLDDPEHAPKLARGRDVDAGHGRIETREASVCANVGCLEEHAWPGPAAVGEAERTREAGGKTDRETAYFPLSAALPPERFGEVVRAHRGVENGLHRVLDVTRKPQPHRQRTAQPGPAAALGARRDRAGRLQEIEQGQVQAGRLGRRLPGAAPRISRKESSPTALNSAERHMR